jgi:hypothetical protein
LSAPSRLYANPLFEHDFFANPARFRQTYIRSAWRDKKEAGICIGSSITGRLGQDFGAGGEAAARKPTKHILAKTWNRPSDGTHPPVLRDRLARFAGQRLNLRT